MEQYIVIAKLVANTKDKYEGYRILQIDIKIDVEEQIPEGYEKVSGPASLDDCVEYIKKSTVNKPKEIDGNQPNWFGLTVAQYILIGVVTLAFVWVVVNGALKLQGFNSDNTVNLIATADDGARVLITFLVAVATVAIAFLAILTAMILREYKERFALAKEVLTILVGILGTIVGFYFGTAGNPKPNTTTSTNTNINTNTNTNTNSNANSNRVTPTPANTTNTNSTVRIIRLPSGKDVSLAYKQDGKWKIIV